MYEKHKCSGKRIMRLVVQVRESVWHNTCNTLDNSILGERTVSLCTDGHDTFFSKSKQRKYFENFLFAA